MPWTMAGSAAVIVAQQFNPSIITSHWLVRNHVLEEGDFQEGSLYSDVVVQVRSRQFHMLVLPEQLQFVPNNAPPQQQQLIVEKLGTIVRMLPHTPYRGLGLNFSWHLAAIDGDIAELSRNLCCAVERPLYQNFPDRNAHFGAYMSKDFVGFRLRLDIKPILVPIDGQQENRLQFAFNFHCDLGEEGARQIEERLAHWDEVNEEVGRIIDSVEAR